MPFTPFHWGPSSWLGLLLFRFINIGAFLVASVVIDIEPFCVLVFNLNYPLHGFLHSFVGGTIAAAVLSVAYYHFREVINKLLNPIKLAQKSSYGVILFSCLAGVYFHVFLDSFLYTDIRPFFPLTINPFYGLISFPIMYSFCAVSFLVGGLLYVMKWNEGKWPQLLKAAGTLTFLFFGLAIAFFLKETTRLPFGKLANIQKQIDSKVEQVYKTGQDGTVIFLLPSGDGTIVISPPYAVLADLGKDILRSDLLKRMQSFVDSQETGHLFYIENGQLIDHRLLSGSAEPILGMSAKKEMVFLISRKSTSGRPVRIEIAGNQTVK